MFIYVLGLNSVFCKRHPNSFDSNISREYYSHGEGNARVKMGKKKENQACLETIWKLCVYLKKNTIYLKIQVNIKINYLSFKILSIATIYIYILGLVFAVSLPSHEHYRFRIKYVLEQDH